MRLVNWMPELFVLFGDGSFLDFIPRKAKRIRRSPVSPFSIHKQGILSNPNFADFSEEERCYKRADNYAECKHIKSLLNWRLSTAQQLSIYLVKNFIERR